MRSHDALTLSGRELAGPLRPYVVLTPCGPSLALLTPHPVLTLRVTVSRYAGDFRLSHSVPGSIQFKLLGATHEARYYSTGFDTTTRRDEVVLLVNISTLLDMLEPASFQSRVLLLWNRLEQGVAMPEARD